MNLLTRLRAWLEERRELPRIRHRRRYLAALSERSAAEAVVALGLAFKPTPEVRATHVPCGLRHLPWEYCPARPGDPAGGEWRPDSPAR